MSFSSTYVFQILVICPYKKGLLGTLQPMAPLLEGHLDCQEYPVANVVISFRGGQATREESTGMELVVSP